MINLTDLAKCKIKESLKKRGKGLGIKIGIKTTGCSGLAYTMEYVDIEQGKEHCVEHHDIDGVRIYLSPEHRPFLYGLTVDWIKQGLNEGFDFINPNEKGRCGCGESFRL